MRRLIVRNAAALCTLAAMLAAPMAQAQQWPGEMPPPLSFSGAPTILESAGPAPVIAEQRFKMGEVVASFAVQYARVGRLKNDVYRTQAFTKATTPTLPAGTPVFRTQLITDSLDIQRRGRGPAHWCAVIGQDKRPLCWEEGKGTNAGLDKVYLGHPFSTSASPYFPMGDGLTDLRSANFPIIELDDTARSGLPPMELVYVQKSSNPCNAFQAGLRVAGKTYMVWNVDYNCSNGPKGDRTRAMSFPIGDGVVCAHHIGDDGADISVMRQPTKYVHPHMIGVLDAFFVELRTWPASKAPRPDCPPTKPT